jgi:hypothetical protein
VQIFTGSFPLHYFVEIVFGRRGAFGYKGSMRMATALEIDIPIRAVDAR